MGIIFGLDSLSARNEKYETIQNDIVENVDVCIIGSGAGGAVLAKELVESGKRVVLLEKGGYYEGKDMNQRDADMLPLLWKNSGFNFDDNLKIAIAQGSCLGGSTVINDAVCFDTPQRVREEWKKMGVNFTDVEWDFHTKRVNDILHVSEVTDFELNRNSMMLKKGAEKLNFQEHRKNKRNCINCMQCGFCHLGCHYETKQNVLVTYLHKALSSQDSNFHVYCNCDANKIIYKDGVVEGIEGDFIDAGGEKIYRIRVNSKIVIISAGSIASSKFLLENGIAQKTAGRGLCLHPAPFIMGDFDYEIKGNQGIPMAYTIHDFGVTRSSDKTRNDWSFDGGEFLIESIFLPLLQFSIAIPSGVGEHQMLLERFNNYAMAGILIRDNNNGRVAVTPMSRTSITYDVGQNELKSMAKGMEIISKMWFALGAKRIISSHRKAMIIDKEEDIPKLVDNVLNDPGNLLLGSAHPQSGNKIGLDPNNSVVDSDCKVHGFQNLFVCDASVFPNAVGVNPQITVMTFASIISSRIANDWKAKYDGIVTSSSLGKTCSILQPMFCLKQNLSDLFDSTDTIHPASMLVNSSSDKIDDTNWSFDPKTLLISNNTHWKGIFTRDHDLENMVNLYAGGFWKRFSENNSKINGVTHPFEAGVYASNIAEDQILDGFGKVIQLEYTQFPFDRFYDVLKIVDENTILGKAFANKPVPGREMMTFCMSRKYPLEFMSEDDHEMLYSKMNKPILKDMVGIWEGYLVSDSTWSDAVFKFRYYFDGTVFKNDYIFGGTLAGTALVTEENDHVTMRDETVLFHDEIRQVNENLMIGKYYSQPNDISKWLGSGPSFIHTDESRNSFYLPYVLKRVGEESAYKI